MLVQNSITFEANVAQKVACFFVAEPFYSGCSRQPVAPIVRVAKLIQAIAQPHRYSLAQVIARANEVRGPHVVKPIRRRLLERASDGRATATVEQRPDRVHRSRTHRGGRAGGENAVDHFFPQARIGTALPDGMEFTKSSPDFVATRVMRDP